MDKKVMMAGMGSGMAMAMFSMTYEALWGLGFWAPPVFISGFFLRAIQEVPVPVVFALVPIIVGIVAHMLFSMFLARLFLKHIRKRNITGKNAMMRGVIFGIIVFVVMWAYILPLFNKVMLSLNMYGFLGAHILWGAMLGGMLGGMIKMPMMKKE